MGSKKVTSSATIMATVTLFFLAMSSTFASVLPQESALGLVEQSNFGLNCDNNPGITNHCAQLGYSCTSSINGLPLPGQTDDDYCDLTCVCGIPQEVCTVGPHGITTCPRDVTANIVAERHELVTDDAAEPIDHDLEKRQVNYAFVCSNLGGVPDRSLTNGCNSKGYYCLKGKVRQGGTKSYTCEDACKCIKMTPNPPPIWGCIQQAVTGIINCQTLIVNVDNDIVLSPSTGELVGTLSNSTTTANGTHIFTIDSGGTTSNDTQSNDLIARNVAGATAHDLEKRQANYAFICYNLAQEPDRATTTACNSRGYLCKNGKVFQAGVLWTVCRDFCTCKRTSPSIFGCIGANLEIVSCCRMVVDDDDVSIASTGQFVGTLSNSTVDANGTHTFDVAAPAGTTLVC